MSPAALTRLYGLTIATDLPVSSRDAAPGKRDLAASEADLIVRLGPPLDDQDEPLVGTPFLDLTVDGVSYQRATRLDDGGSLLRYWRVCDFAIDRSLQHATVRIMRGADVGLGAILVEGALPAMVLLLRGEGVLHASAVEIDGRAVAFVGRSGMGKSTLAALICRHGGRLVTDDVLRYEVVAGRVLGFAGTGEMRLRPASRSLAHQYSRRWRRQTSDGRTAVRPDLTELEKLPVDALVLPRLRQDVDRVSSRRLRGAEALLTLLRFPRFPGLLDPGVSARQMARLAELADAVPVTLLDVPWGQPNDPALGEELRAVIDGLVFRPSMSE